jgi:hypothetical protein
LSQGLKPIEWRPFDVRAEALTYLRGNGKGEGEEKRVLAADNQNGNGKGTSKGIPGAEAPFVVVQERPG